MRGFDAAGGHDALHEVRAGHRLHHYGGTEHEARTEPHGDRRDHYDADHQCEVSAQHVKDALQPRCHNGLGRRYRCDRCDS